MTPLAEEQVRRVLDAFLAYASTNDVRLAEFGSKSEHWGEELGPEEEDQLIDDFVLNTRTNLEPPPPATLDTP